jgi:hypothetical protein
MLSNNYNEWVNYAVAFGCEVRKVPNSTIEDPYDCYVAAMTTQFGDYFYGFFVEPNGDGPAEGMIFNSPSFSVDDIFNRTYITE